MAESRGPRGSVARATVETVAGQGTVLVMGILRGIAAARLVSPKEFGTYVVAAAFLGFLEIATQPGLHEAIVAAERPPPRRVLRTVWTLNVVRGIALGAATYLAAPALAALVSIPEAQTALQLLAAVPVLRGLQSLEPSLRQRATRLTLFASVAGLGAIGGLAGTIVGGSLIPTAVGLSIGLVAESAIRTATSYSFGGFMPRPLLALRETTSLLRFASWRFGSNLVTYAAMNIDDLVVGRAVGPAAAGGYRISYRLSSAATTDLPYMLGHVMLPTFRQLLTDSPANVSGVYRRYAGSMVAIGATLALALAPVADIVIVRVLGAEWGFVTTAFLIFLGGGLIRAILSSGVPLFLAAGRPGLDARMQAIRLVALLGGLFLLAPAFGLEGAAWASTLSAAAAVAPWALGVRSLGLSPGGILLRAAACLAPGVAAFVVSIAGRTLLGPSLWSAALSVLLGVGASFAYAALIDRRLIGDVRSLAALGQSRFGHDHG